MHENTADANRFGCIYHAPCGVADQRYGVTSLVDLGLPLSMADVDMALRREFENLFGPTNYIVGSAENNSPGLESLSSSAVPSRS